MATTQRGSLELLKQRPLDEADLKMLEDALAEHEVEFIHWFPKGQPHPDVLFGAVRARPEAVGSVVTSLLKHDRLRLKLDVFPNGLPAIDSVIIGFKTQQSILG